MRKARLCERGWRGGRGGLGRDGWRGGLGQRVWGEAHACLWCRFKAGVREGGGKMVGLVYKGMGRGSREGGAKGVDGSVFQGPSDTQSMLIN